MFRPNVIAMLHRKLAARTPFAQALYGSPVRIQCGIVDLGTMIAQSAVRADNSASRGDAQIVTIQNAIILVPANTKVTEGDVLMIDGLKIEVNGIMPKHNILGKLDHLQLNGTIKGDMP